MASNITNNFKAKAGLRMNTGGALGGYQPNEQISTTKLASVMLAQEQASDKLTAMNSLSNTEMSQLAGNQPYHADGSASNAGRSSATPGSAAARSMAEQQLGIQQKMTDASNMSRLNRLGAATGDNTGGTMYRDFLGNQRNRGNAFQFGLGLRAGGVVDPAQSKLYKIDGPGDGSGVDDEVDVNVHGKKIKVSKNERFAVFPASIPAESIEEFIESQTGEPSATAGRGLRDGMQAEYGAVVGLKSRDELAKEVRRAPLEPEATSTFDPRTHVGVVPLTPYGSMHVTQPGANIVEEKPYVDPNLKSHAPITSADEGASIRALNEQVMRGGVGAPPARPIGLERQSADNPPLIRAETLINNPGSYEEKLQRADARGQAAVAKAPVMNKATGVDPSGAPLESYKPASLKQALDDKETAGTAVVWAAQDAMGKSHTPGMTGMGKSNAGMRALVNDPAIMNAMNSAQNIRGTGIKFDTRVGSDGQKQIMLSGGEPTTPQYIGADGKPTNNWYATQAYRDSIARAQQNKLTLRNMERASAMRDMGSDIRDPRAVATAGLRIAAMNEEDKNAADKAYKNASLDVQRARLEHDLRKEEREAKKANRKEATAHIDKLIEKESMEERDGKWVVNEDRANKLRTALYAEGDFPTDLKAAEETFVQRMNKARAALGHDKRVEGRSALVKLADWGAGIKPSLTNGQATLPAKVTQANWRDMLDVGPWDALVGNNVVRQGGVTTDLRDYIQRDGAVDLVQRQQLVQNLSQQYQNAVAAGNVAKARDIKKQLARIGEK